MCISLCCPIFTHLTVPYNIGEGAKNSLTLILYHIVYSLLLLWWVVGGGWWVVDGGWWVVGGGWWVVGGGWWVVGGEWWVVGSRGSGVVHDGGFICG